MPQGRYREFTLKWFEHNILIYPDTLVFCQRRFRRFEAGDEEPTLIFYAFAHTLYLMFARGELVSITGIMLEGESKIVEKYGLIPINYIDKAIALAVEWQIIPS